MALPQSAVSELLDAFRTGDGVDLIRESVRMVMQELIEAEATEHIGAGRYKLPIKLQGADIPAAVRFQQSLVRRKMAGVFLRNPAAAVFACY